jgi:hypothetical protein
MLLYRLQLSVFLFCFRYDHADADLTLDSGRNVGWLVGDRKM